ncbi:CRISPR-associated protein Cas5 [Streptomyces sp. RFCAC02]|uniref:CRISPR-associated protein Cas5 n=1 Tax=Streptomyces sp. RFCAC02 TaxID=2499143 RepID=UPI00101FE99D|nr:CRISPR-associated protein Cas5 [Streptomyces sp. RFCAC02]
MSQALELTVTAPVVSFRNPLYAGMQVGLPCPPPSTVGGMLAAAAGGWDRVPAGTRFGMAFRAVGSGTDLETFHPLSAPGAPITIKDRDFLALITLRVWLLDDLEPWQRAIRRPVWPMKLGRSQDLVTVTAKHVSLRTSVGVQGHAVVPQDVKGATGTQMRLTTAVSLDRQRVRWDSYHYAASGSSTRIDTGFVTEDDQAVALLPPVHPHQLNTTPAEA